MQPSKVDHRLENVLGGKNIINRSIRFLGAAETVTGSRFLLESGEGRYLIDCGLFQGGRKMKELNWLSFPISPKKIDAVLVTHAHIDHTGYLPRLVREGFQGPIFATEATCVLLEILLRDSAYLQEQDAAYANKKGYSRHKPALPLYTTTDAEQAIQLLHPIKFFHPEALDSLSATWHPAGHILGSAILELKVPHGGFEDRLIFSGDLGRCDDEIMNSPTKLGRADILFVESTYGNRLRQEGNIQDILADVIKNVIAQEGVLLIPAFAVGRTQLILYHLRQLQNQGRVPDIPIFIDSPMAVDVSRIYCRFGDDHNLDVSLLMDQTTCPLRCKDTHFIQDVEASKELNTRPGPAIILSASGMCTGGRILHHLKWRLPDERNAVLFVGYQAEGTRGRILIEGAEKIRIHGEKIPVRAKIVQAHTLSAHADQDEIMDWLTGFDQPPRKTFIVHGEPDSSQALKEKIHQELGWSAIVPKFGEIHSLT